MTQPSPDGPPPARPAKVVWAVLAVVAVLVAILLAIYLLTDAEGPAPAPGTVEPAALSTGWDSEGSIFYSHGDPN
jgi:hypothetical protein